MRNAAPEHRRQPGARECTGQKDPDDDEEVAGAAGGPAVVIDERQVDVLRGGAHVRLRHIHGADLHIHVSNAC
ncbi:hypothetical protein ACWEO4_29860 [Streptomyces sp. NPDC004393]|uniref:hypothetical protein n=1 Tax=Streptomyces sp. NPDC004533 TaxID=3154278 RepID=UPI0033AC0B72